MPDKPGDDRCDGWSRHRIVELGLEAALIELFDVVYDGNDLEQDCPTSRIRTSERPSWSESCGARRAEVNLSWQVPAPPKPEAMGISGQA